jgi:hypothetical protein
VIVLQHQVSALCVVMQCSVRLRWASVVCGSLGDHSSKEYSLAQLRYKQIISQRAAPSRLLCIAPQSSCRPSDDAAASPLGETTSVEAQQPS